MIFKVFGVELHPDRALVGRLGLWSESQLVAHARPNIVVVGILRQ